MADEDDKKKKKACSVCDGNGGWWQTNNGHQFKNRRWVTCPTCKGTGTAA